MTTTIHFVRHAAHGLLGRTLTGRMPGVSLGEEGRAQAEALSLRLGRERIAAIHSSPLERARETAEPIARRLGLEVQVTAAIQEIDFGEWTGAAFGDLDADPRWRIWNEARSLARPPGGETMLEAQGRVLRHLEDLQAAHPGESVALVSHADVIKAALAFLLGLSLDALPRFEISPASISTVVIGDWGAKVLTLNEVPA